MDVVLWNHVLPSIEYDGNLLECRIAINNNASYSLTQENFRTRTHHPVLLYTQKLPPDLKNFLSTYILSHVPNTRQLQRPYCEMIIQFTDQMKLLEYPPTYSRLIRKMICLGDQLRILLDTPGDLLDLDGHLQNNYRSQSILDILDFVTHTEVAILFFLPNYDPFYVNQLDIFITSYRDVCNTCSISLLAFLFSVRTGIPVDKIHIFAHTCTLTSHAGDIYGGAGSDRNKQLVYGVY